MCSLGEMGACAPRKSFVPLFMSAQTHALLEDEKKQRRFELSHATPEARRQGSRHTLTLKPTFLSDKVSAQQKENEGRIKRNTILSGCLLTTNTTS